jgi:hypothetical protein
MPRLHSFFKEFCSFLLKFDSLWSITSKIVLVAGGCVMFAFLKSPVYITIYFPFSPWYFPQLTLGICLIGILIIMFIFIGIGVSIVRSTSQRMHVAHDLQYDEANNRIRLSVINNGRYSIQPVATIEWIESDDGINYKATPIDCDWMNNKNEAVSYGDEIKIDVVGFNIDNKITACLGNRTKANHYINIKLEADNGKRQGFSFCVKISIPNTNIIQYRTFRLDPDNRYPFELKHTELRHHKKN